MPMEYERGIAIMKHLRQVLSELEELQKSLVSPPLQLDLLTAKQLVREASRKVGGVNATLAMNLPPVMKSGDPMQNDPVLQEGLAALAELNTRAFAVLEPVTRVLLEGLPQEDSELADLLKMVNGLEYNFAEIIRRALRRREELEAERHAVRGGQP
jgi:hypothetical protein